MKGETINIRSLNLEDEKPDAEILIADDDSDLVETYMGVAQAVGIDPSGILVANDPLTALHYLAASRTGVRRRIHTVISDLDLKFTGLDGIDIIRLALICDAKTALATTHADNPGPIRKKAKERGVNISGVTMLPKGGDPQNLQRFMNFLVTRETAHKKAA